MYVAFQILFPHSHIPFAFCIGARCFTVCKCLNEDSQNGRLIEWMTNSTLLCFSASVLQRYFLASVVYWHPFSLLYSITVSFKSFQIHQLISVSSLLSTSDCKKGSNRSPTIINSEHLHHPGKCLCAVANLMRKVIH